MLIITMPRTASTSLINTIKDAQSEVKICRLEKVKEKHDDYLELSKWHSNIGIRSDEVIERFVTDKTMIYRDHLIPTEEHLKSLEKYSEPIIILLRNPLHIFDCYLRDKKFELKEVDVKKLQEELNTFKNIYQQWAIGKKNVIVVYFKELVLHPNKTLAKILNIFGVKNYIIPEFRKDMFTGVGIKRLK